MNSLPQTKSAQGKGKKLLRSGMIFFIITFGLVLPLITLSIEILFAWCAQDLFDPIPTIAHVLMVATVPLANLLGLLVIFGKFQSARHKILFINGLAISISAFYSILFIPITPMAIIALIWLIGILPLTPLLSLIATIICRRMISKPSITDPMPSLAIQGKRFKLSNWGFIAGILMIIAAEIPLTITEIGLQMAVSENQQEQLQGIGLLRLFANHDRLLSYSYDRRNRSRDLLSSLYNWNNSYLSTDQARKIYFRVTGQAFNENDSGSYKRNGLLNNSRWSDFDTDQGGTTVGKRLQHVSLSSSQIDGSIDSDAALAYLQWTFEFTNQSYRQAEARAQIALPPGAVVSRVTLWIDGEEREAAFAGKGQARQAYQSVVSRQRDPVLVTTAGPDTVLVQLFPVPFEGSIKTRIGITAPLVIRNESEGILRLPFFKQKNFNIAEDFKHSVWLDSTATMRSEPAHLIFESANSGAATLRGKLNDAGLKSPANSVLVSRDNRVKTVYTTNPVLNKGDKENSIISQHLIRNYSNINHLVIVIDGSNSMQNYVSQIARAISKLPDTLEFSVIVAADEITKLKADFPASSVSYSQQMAQQLEAFDFVGGVDNTIALEQGWTMASMYQNSALLWIHGPQPVLLSTVDNLKQNWLRRPQGPELFDFPVIHSANRINENLDGISQLKIIPRVANIEQDLSYQFSLWSGQRQQWNAVRSIMTNSELQFPAQKTSDHLLRLWAYDQIKTKIAKDTVEQEQKAIQMATRYQLVTPVSGAVVLENQQQYDDNNLQAVDSGTVPTVPEPETWLLIFSTLIMLGWALYRRRLLANNGAFSA